MIERLRELEGAATPAPWDCYANPQGSGMAAVATWHDWEHKDAEERAERDAALITAMRNALPLLLDVVEAARSVLSEEGVREQLACYTRGVDMIEALAALENKSPPR